MNNENVGQETFLEEKMRAIEEAEEAEVAKPTKALVGLAVSFGILLALHFAPTMPGLKPAAQSSPMGFSSVS